MPKKITKNLEENIKNYEILFSDCADIKKRRIKVGTKLKRECYIAYIEVALNNTEWKESAIGKLLTTLRTLPGGTYFLCQRKYMGYFRFDSL